MVKGNSSRSPGGTRLSLPTGPQWRSPAPSRGWRLRLLFHNRELNLLLHRIDPVHQHPHAIAHAIGLARALADDLARRFVVSVAVVGERREGHEALDEEVGQLHEEAELGHADD